MYNERIWLINEKGGWIELKGIGSHDAGMLENLFLNGEYVEDSRFEKPNAGH